MALTISESFPATKTDAFFSQFNQNGTPLHQTTD
jgi:hypothetical protein